MNRPLDQKLFPAIEPCAGPAQLRPKAMAMAMAMAMIKELPGICQPVTLRCIRLRRLIHPFAHRRRRTAYLALMPGLLSAADVGCHNHSVDALSLGRTHIANESVAG